eukprot:2480098-Pyramimonas_sp.AAC.1
MHPHRCGTDAARDRGGSGGDHSALDRSVRGQRGRRAEASLQTFCGTLTSAPPADACSSVGRGWVSAPNFAALSAASFPRRRNPSSSPMSGSSGDR